MRKFDADEEVLEGVFFVFFFFFVVVDGAARVVDTLAADAASFPGVLGMSSLSVADATGESTFIPSFLLSLFLSSSVLVSASALLAAACCSFSRSFCTSLYRFLKLAFNIPPEFDLANPVAAAGG